MNNNENNIELNNGNSKENLTSIEIFIKQISLKNHEKNLHINSIYLGIVGVTFLFILFIGFFTGLLIQSLILFLIIFLVLKSYFEYTLKIISQDIHKTQNLELNADQKEISSNKINDNLKLNNDIFKETENQVTDNLNVGINLEEKRKLAYYKFRRPKFVPIVFLATVGLILSFFVPILDISGKISYAEILDKASSFADSIGYSLLKNNIYQSLSGFMFSSIIGAICIFIGYIKKGKTSSILGIYGVYFYLSITYGIITNNEQIDNMASLLNKLKSYGLFSGNDIFSYMSGCPGFFMYFFSAIVLVIASISIIIGYIDWYNFRRIELNHKYQSIYK